MPEGSEEHVVVSWRVPCAVAVCFVANTVGDAVADYWKKEVGPMFIAFWMVSMREIGPAVLRKVKILLFRLIMKVRRRGDRGG